MKKRNGMLLALIAICISSTTSANVGFDTETATINQNETLFTKDQACSKNDTNGYLKVTWPGKSAYNFGYNKFVRNGVDELVYVTIVSSEVDDVEYFLYSYNCSTKDINEIAQIDNFYLPIYVNQNSFITSVLLNERCMGGCDGSFTKYLLLNKGVQGDWQRKFDLNKPDTLQGYKGVLDKYVTLIVSELQYYKNKTFVQGYTDKPVGLLNGIIRNRDDVLAEIDNGAGNMGFSQAIITIKGLPYLALYFNQGIYDASNQEISISLPTFMFPLSLAYGSMPQVVDVVYSTISSKEIGRLKDNGLTKYSLLHEFGPMNYFTREQASKFFAQFAIKVLGKVADTNMMCEFSDITTADQTLKQDIITACQLGLFKGFQGKFDPKKNISHEEAITVLVRLLDGKQDETMKPWYTKYLQIGSDKGYIVNDGIGFDIGKSIERGEIGQMLYKAGNK